MAATLERESLLSYSNRLIKLLGIAVIDSDTDLQHMLRACELAQRGEGLVEPNPMVGCVIAIGREVIGEGWHRKFGGPHAEVEAFRSLPQAAKLDAATLYVTLEPCCFTGKTPPCTTAILDSGIRRVVVAVEDPFPEVAGKGIAQLRAAGIQVDLGLAHDTSLQVLAPYLKLQRTGQPWLIAKWAMTLDGKIATPNGDSQWISSPASRAIVHELRSRVDGVMVGIGTALADDPLLTARLDDESEVKRKATRIVVDSQLRIPLTTKLVQTSREFPLLLGVTAAAVEANAATADQLRAAGVELAILKSPTPEARLNELLLELGRRRMTNVLVEGGEQLLGGCWDGQHIDEVCVFVAPKLIGGKSALGPIGGMGGTEMSQAFQISDPQWQAIDTDLYLQGRVAR